MQERAAGSGSFRRALVTEFDECKHETNASIANKPSRGTFPATFLLATMAAMQEGANTLEDV
jgi:hypothetical protein